MFEAIVYTVPDCEFCDRTKSFLARRQVPFLEKNINVDRAAIRELEQMDVQAVPVTVYGAEVIVGFNQSRLLAIFGKDEVMVRRA
jgi:glutaredoxin